MSDEIKEILEIMKKCYNFKDENFDNYISLYQLGLLLDYITNLQKENERLREVVENLTTMTACGDRKQIKNTAQFKLEQLQSRCEKAIEYIKEKYEYVLGDMTFLDHDELVDRKQITYLLNILTGGDKE